MPCAGMIHPWLGQDMDRVRLNKNKDLQNPSPKKSLFGRPGLLCHPGPLQFRLSLQRDQFINDKSEMVHVRNGWGSARKKAKESSR